jgi:segregation and condensation protein A
MKGSSIASPGKTSGYRVELPVFEGPLDLLLHLIEREELDVTRVSLALVTDQYLDYLAALDETDVEDLTDFVAVAAQLLLIKSKMLLPRPPALVAQDDEDVAQDLIQQLLIFKRFKEAAKHLENRRAQGQRSYVRIAPPPTIPTGIEHLETVPLEALVSAARNAMQRLPAEPPSEEVVAPFPITIHDQIDLIRGILSSRPQVNFTDLLASANSRQEIIVTLMAVLELIKLLEIAARQERMFGEIVILPLARAD